MHGHRIPVTTRDTGQLETGRDSLGELGEVGVELPSGPIAGVVRERVVLVGVKRLLEPRLAPEREPRPRYRRLAELVDGAREETPRQRVDRGTHDPAHLGGIGAAGDERAHTTG